LVNVNLAGTSHQSGWQFVGIIIQAPVVIILSLILSFLAGYFVKRSRRRIFLETSFIIILVLEILLFNNSMNPERISTSENATLNQTITNGYWEYYHETGGLKSKGNYEDGLEMGIPKIFGIMAMIAFIGHIKLSVKLESCFGREAYFMAIYTVLGFLTIKMAV